jgi:glycosyltransferase involved in cell wall biosynthesis
MVAPAPPLRVQLVVKPGSAMTGIGRYAAEVSQGLQQVGVDLHHAPLRDPVPAPVSRLGRRLGYDLEAFAKSYPLRAVVRQGYLTHLTSQTLATLLFTQRLPRPVVVTVHDIVPYLVRDDPELKVYRNRLDRAIDGLAMRGLRRADRLIADSHYTKRTLTEALGICPKRVDVVHLGIDTNHFTPLPVPNDFYTRYGLPTDRQYVLFVGSEDPRKNFPLLLRAMALVRRTVPDTILLKVGAPEFREQRDQNLGLCRELGIAGVVKWVDLVPEADLPLFYNAADVLAFPSRYEGFGLPVLEALACGTPVAAARISSIPELVGDAATLIDELAPEPLAVKIVDTIRAGKCDREAMIRQARQFTWEGTGQGIRESYRRVISVRGPHEGIDR